MPKETHDDEDNNVNTKSAVWCNLVSSSIAMRERARSEGEMKGDVFSTASEKYGTILFRFLF